MSLQAKSSIAKVITPADCNDDQQMKSHGHYVYISDIWPNYGQQINVNRGLISVTEWTTGENKALK